MGTGAPHASAGEWNAISSLMQAALPALRSCLLDKPDGVLLPSAKDSSSKPPASGQQAGKGSGPKSGPSQSHSAKPPPGTSGPLRQVSSAPSLAALQSGTQPGSGLQLQPCAPRPSTSCGSTGRPLQDITNMLDAQVLRNSGSHVAIHQGGPASHRSDASQGSVGSGAAVLGGGVLTGSQPRVCGPAVPTGSQASGGDQTQGAAVAAIVQLAGAQANMPPSNASATEGGDLCSGPDLCKKQWVAVPSHETHLQRILLESIANGSVSTGPTIATLLT
jgi:hypothetical protein